jgi:hypothetical protein
MHTANIFFLNFFFFFNKHKNESLLVFHQFGGKNLFRRVKPVSGKFRIRISLTEESDGHLLLDVGALENFAELLEGDEGVLKT